jgi:hypothetical protein
MAIADGAWAAATAVDAARIRRAVDRRAAREASYLLLK